MKIPKNSSHPRKAPHFITIFFIFFAIFERKIGFFKKFILRSLKSKLYEKKIHLDVVMETIPAEA
jgi:hypothetical protein